MRFILFPYSFFPFLLFFWFSCSYNSGRLPIYGERNPVTKMVHGKAVTDTAYKTIPYFKYLNQDSVIIESKNLKNKIYIADFFFTSCPTICPIMQKNMGKLADKYQSDTDIFFLSFTIDPLHDSLGRLRRYKNLIGTHNKNWNFLRGNRDSTFILAEKGFYATANSDSTAPGGFVHSGGLILVDRIGRIRGIYDGTIEEDVFKLEGDIKELEMEKDF